MKSVARNSRYEIRFQLVIVGLDRAFESIKKYRDILHKEGETEEITAAKIILVENACLLMDFIINFSDDDMLYKALERVKNQNWLGDLILSMKFVEKYLDLLDEPTTKEFEYVKSIMPKIINSEPLPEYPHENSVKQFLRSDENIKKDYENRRSIKLPTIDDIRFEL